MQAMSNEVEDLLQDLWAVYYGNPRFKNGGEESDETPGQVMARALIVLLENAQLPDDVSIPS